MRSPWWVACVLWAVAAVAFAGKGAPPPEAEAGMLVSGRIIVGPDGKPREYELKDPEKLPENVRRFLEFHIPRWAFDPPMLDNKPVALDNLMDIHLKAVREGEGMRIQLAGASFRPAAAKTPYEIRPRRMKPPAFPTLPDSVAGDVGAVVYVVLMIGPDGKVLEALDEQVNLHFVPDAQVADAWRKRFVQPTLRAARSWTFDPPVRGEEAVADYWTVRVPVTYHGWKAPRLANQYGRWQAYVPGPRRQVPWVDAAGAREPLEALASDTLYLSGQEDQLKLLPGQAGT